MTSDAVCNRFHRYARHVNFFAVVKPAQGLNYTEMAWCIYMYCAKIRTKMFMTMWDHLGVPQLLSTTQRMHCGKWGVCIMLKLIHRGTRHGNETVESHQTKSELAVRKCLRTSKSANRPQKTAKVHGVWAGSLAMKMVTQSTVARSPGGTLSPPLWCFFFVRPTIFWSMWFSAGIPPVWIWSCQSTLMARSLTCS